MRRCERVAHERERVAPAGAAHRGRARTEAPSPVPSRVARRPSGSDDLRDRQQHEERRREAGDRRHEDPPPAARGRVDERLRNERDELRRSRTADDFDGRGAVRRAVDRRPGRRPRANRDTGVAHGSRPDDEGAAAGEAEHDAGPHVLGPFDVLEEPEIERDEDGHLPQARAGGTDRRRPADRVRPWSPDRGPPAGCDHHRIGRPPDDPSEPRLVVGRKSGLDRARARKALRLVLRRPHPGAQSRVRRLQRGGEPCVGTLDAVRAQRPVDRDGGDGDGREDREHGETDADDRAPGERRCAGGEAIRPDTGRTRRGRGPAGNTLAAPSCHREGTLQGAAAGGRRYGRSAVARATAAAAAPENPANTASTPTPITASTTAHSAMV